MLAATIRAGNFFAPVRIRNMSTGGAMVDGPALPEVGSDTILKRLELSASALVIWKKDGRCGLKLDCRIEPDDWVAGILRPPKDGNLGQLRVDAIQATLRNGESLPVEPEPEPQGSPQPVDGVADRRIADELLHVRAMLEAVADTLSGDMDVVTKHQRALQDFDLALSIVTSLAEVVAADDREQAIADVAMHDLRSRLSGAPSVK